MPKGTLINFYHGDVALGSSGYSWTSGNNGALVSCEPWMNTNSAAKQLWVDNVCINPHLKLSNGTNTQSNFSLTYEYDTTTGEVSQVLTFTGGVSPTPTTIPDHWKLSFKQYNASSAYDYLPTDDAAAHTPAYLITVGDNNHKLTFDSTTATINHATISTANTTSSATPAHGASFTVIDSVTMDGYGHITSYNTKTVTLPADSDSGDTNTTYDLTADTDGGLTMNSQLVSGKYANAKWKLTSSDTTPEIDIVTLYHKAENNGIGSVVSFKEMNDNVIEMEILKIDGGTF